MALVVYIYYIKKRGQQKCSCNICNIATLQQIHTLGRKRLCVTNALPLTS